VGQNGCFSVINEHKLVFASCLEAIADYFECFGYFLLVVVVFSLSAYKQYGSLKVI